MPRSHQIVGVWYVRIFGAPFEHHLLTFHADGTVLQANPDAGDPTTSDSVAMGLWQASDDIVRAKIVETTADRERHSFISRGEISLNLSVSDDALTGTASASFYNEQNVRLKEPTHETLTGQRITLDTPLAEDTE